MHTCLQIALMVGDDISDIIAVVNTVGAADKHACPAGHRGCMDCSPDCCRVEVQCVVPAQQQGMMVTNTLCLLNKSHGALQQAFCLRLSEDIVLTPVWASAQCELLVTE